ncbi:hypothetical protein M3184_06075 [Metabacillus litoralis]|uniref:Uncharacterized protein n=1 Tax=Metabacillus rhizolycopersici TaxID=2875709 RepID=A0ABS7UVI3_9BACI|nr:hypothetical protein [Metabacillus rhizolycopersici]MBZ5752318.1 hypothetical protein [Metabacillus rhizolycopersici]MCM3651415.1 hypothetical protein [Metabacillus litoralis]
MKMKISVCLSIFLLLFSTAFLLQQKSHREFYVHKIESNIDNMKVIPINVQATDVQKKVYEPFKSREYVRIVDSQ